MTGGYSGRTLWVDLTNRQVEVESTDEKWCREYIGGYGVGVRALFSRQKGGVDPLGPDNILGFVTGPFTGSPVLAGSRYTVVAKSPLTGCWGDANSGGYFGPHLKFAGYDALFFRGLSERPVYLFLDSGKAEIRDAGPLWGQDSYATEETLRSELGEDVETACIGPSGELQSRLAAVMNNRGRAAGRAGLGAVMGSKKLKAIAVKGALKIPFFNEDKVKELSKDYRQRLQGGIGFLGAFGTAASTVRCAHSGDGPVKNYNGVGIRDFPHPDPLDVNLLMLRQEKKYACYRCPVACGGQMKAGTGEYQYAAGSHKPEYESMAMFGANCLNNNLESLIMANDICNRYGIDTISAGATISFTIECFENGLLSLSDTDGLEMRWGNHRSIVAMTEKMAKREGFGAILADGVKEAARRIGKGSAQFAVHIQGQEVPAHDPKLGVSFGITYRMDATPGRHTQGPNPAPPDALPAMDRKTVYGRGKYQKLGSCLYHIVNCSGICSIAFSCLPTVNILPEYLRAITGWEVDMAELWCTGERIANLRQAFNIREGINSLQFEVPGRVIGQPPLSAGPTAGFTLDEKTIDREMLVEMDWDPQTTKPSRQKLVELGLGDVAAEIWDKP
jgi:aldehyde:ferredoxin oxidoreductase